MRARLFPVLILIVALVAAGMAVWTWTRGADPSLALRGGEPAVTVAVLNNGFHTDLAVPRRAIEARSGPLAETVRGLGGGDWILIGWGDARFYVDQSPISDRLPDGARAFFRPNNPSVIMLDPAQTDPRTGYRPDQRRDLHLSPRAFDRVMDRIEGSLDLSSGKPQLAAQRPGDDARFYASRETFSVLHLCNHWAAEVLNAGGLPIRPGRAVASSEVIATLDRAHPAALDLPATSD